MGLDVFIVVFRQKLTPWKSIFKTVESRWHWLLYAKYSWNARLFVLYMSFLILYTRMFLLISQNCHTKVLNTHVVIFIFSFHVLAIKVMEETTVWGKKKPHLRKVFKKHNFSTIGKANIEK